MCGRYFLDLDDDSSEKLRVIVEELNRGGLADGEPLPKGEVFPSNLAPVIVAKEGGGFTVGLMGWGFPRFQGNGLVINSRSEKAEVTPLFQQAVRSRRCLVPVQGFYEWKRGPAGAKTKQRYAFTLAQSGPGELMYLAGVYGAFPNGPAGEPVDRFAIMTQAADAQMAPYHDRMPVILREESIKKAWLASSAVPYESLRGHFLPPRLLVTAA